MAEVAPRRHTDGEVRAMVKARADERARLGALLEANAETIGRFAPDPVAAVRLVAFMIQLGDETAGASS